MEKALFIPHMIQPELTDVQFLLHQGLGLLTDSSMCVMHLEPALT